MNLIINHNLRGTVSNERMFWEVLIENIPNSKGIDFDSLTVPIKEKLDELKPDWIIQNALLGKISDYKTISFLQDPYIEMIKKCQPMSLYWRARLRGRQTMQDKLKKQKESLENSIRVTNSNYMSDMYSELGDFTVIPLGVNSELFHPMDKIQTRKKYNIPKDKTVKIFVGSQHPVKGFDKIIRMINESPNVFWILVLKDKKIPDGHNYKVFVKISQKILSELYNCADICVSRSVTESFGLALVEAMFCNIPVDVPKIGIFWDWDPDIENARVEAFKKKLDIDSFIKRWIVLTDRVL